MKGERALIQANPCHPLSRLVQRDPRVGTQYDIKFFHSALVTGSKSVSPQKIPSIPKRRNSFASIFPYDGFDVGKRDASNRRRDLCRHSPRSSP